MEDGFSVAFQFFALGLLCVFTFGMLLGIVHFVKNLLG